MASGRTFQWIGPDGNSILFSKAGGYWVLNGVKGLGRPNYQNDLQDNTAADGVTLRGSRAAFREVFLPMSIEAPDRATLLDRLQYFGEVTNPKKGPGYLYITDGGQLYRLKCLYKEGMEGDESAEVAGEHDGYWQKTGPTFQAVDPYFEDPTLLTEEYGFTGSVPFFSSPFFPLKLDSAQVLSDVSQPVRNNFVLNPSAELDSLNWTTTLSGSVASVITRSALFAGGAAPSGSWVFQIAASASAPSGSLGFPDMTSSSAPFTIGQQYTLHGWAYVPTGQPNVQPGIFFVTSGSTITVKDQWVWFSVPWVATATNNRPYVGMPVAASGEFFYTDKVAVTEGLITTPEEYIDGDQLNSHWIGTPHASGSFQDALYEPSVISNPGTVESYPVIQVIGPGSSFIAENLRSGRRLTAMLATPLGSGQVATFDFRDKTAQLGDGTNLYRYLTEDDFWPLLDGDNAVRLSLAGASAGSKVIVTWFRRFEAIVG